MAMAMASTRAFSFPFSYSCSQPLSDRNHGNGPHRFSQRSAAIQTLRSCCRLRMSRVTLPVSCALCLRDVVEDLLSLKSTQKPTVKKISCIQDGYSSVASNLVTGLATVGGVGATYVTLVKLFGGTICFPCAISCSDVAGFGLPLSEGVYGTIALLGCLVITRAFLEIVGATSTKWLFSGSTSALASPQAWISNSFNSDEAKTVAGLQVATSVLVLLALSSTQTGIALALNSSTDIDLPPLEPKVTTSSSSLNLSLAKHLQTIGAKMYGAFWCSHCFDQKQMFGQEAIKYLNYVECYPEGYRRGVKIAKACDAANIKSFPTWIIKGEVLSGEQQLSELAHVAGFDGFDLS